MTAAPGRQRASAEWQTWLVLAGTVWVGWWLAGGGFGYSLFAVVWAPIAALFLTDRRGWRSLAAGAGAAALFAIPWIVDCPVMIAARLTGWLTLFVCTTAALRNGLAAIKLDRTNTSGLAAVLWIGGLCLPLFVAAQSQALLGDAVFARVLAVHPILLINRSDSGAADWTHQNVAYTYLTRLGQDVPFTWASSGYGLSLYSAVSIFGAVVPRRTSVF